MHRRRLLATATALVGPIVAGCISESRDASGPRAPPETPWEIDEADGDREGADQQNGEKSDETDESTATQTEPSGDLRVVGVDFEDGQDGQLLVRVRVENVVDSERSGELIVETVAQDDVYIETKSITVDGGQTAEFEVEPGVEFEYFVVDGRVDATVSTEP